MNNTLLTIAIPTWNRCAYLEEALVSISEQAAAMGIAGKIEVLIADNCSNDDTSGVVRRFQEAGILSIQWHRHHKNLGPLPNFIYCFSHAAGTFFMLLGDDDLLAPGGLDAVWGTLEKEKSAAVFIFKNVPDNGLFSISTECRVSTKDAARRAFYHMGNAGVFVVRSDYARQAITQCGPDHQWTCWLQTEVMLRAAVISQLDLPFVLSPQTSSSSPYHGPNTRYTAYYLWETMMVGLARTALNARKAVGEEIFEAAIGHLSSVKYVALKFWMLAKLLALSDTPQERLSFQRLTAQTNYLKVPGLARWFQLAQLIGYVPVSILRIFVQSALFIRHYTTPGHQYQKAAVQGGRSYTAEDFAPGGNKQ